MPLENGLTWLNFDFFVNWGKQNTPVENELWLKVPVGGQFLRDSVGADGEGLREFLSREADFVQLVRFGKRNGFNVSAIVFDDEEDFRSGLNGWIFSVPSESSSFSCRKLTLGELTGLIQKYSGGPVKIGSKGLTYGTTRLECFLSRTDAAWPGDVDALLVDSKADFAPKAILEFKKCTEKARVDFSEERFGNYYPQRDRRKYDRLGLLGKRLCAGGGLPIHIIFYSNQEHERRLIFEIAELLGRPASLRVTHRTIYDVELKNDEDVRNLMAEHLKSTVG